MRDIRRAAARLAAATTGLLTLMCSGRPDANAPVDWLSAVRGAWAGGVSFTYDDRGIPQGFGCGTLSATIEAAPDGQLSGAWTFAGCGSYSGSLAGTITGQTVTLSLTTSQGSNLFQKVSEYGACSDPVTAAPLATGTISTSDYDGTVRLRLQAEASLSFVVDPLPGFASPVCYLTSGVWRWYASRAP
jgi:hypothetical protein